MGWMETDIGQLVTSALKRDEDPRENEPSLQLPNAATPKRDRKADGSSRRFHFTAAFRVVKASALQSASLGDLKAKIYFYVRSVGDDALHMDVVATNSQLDLRRGDVSITSPTRIEHRNSHSHVCRRISGPCLLPHLCLYSCFLRSSSGALPPTTTLHSRPTGLPNPRGRNVRLPTPGLPQTSCPPRRMLRSNLLPNLQSSSRGICNTCR